MSAPVITSAKSDAIVEISQGTPTFEVAATCQADPVPTAELFVDFGWPFFTSNVRKMWNLPVTDNGNGSFTARQDIRAPWAWTMPFLDSAKRWVRFTNASGSVDGGKIQVKVTP